MPDKPATDDITKKIIWQLDRLSSRAVVQQVEMFNFPFSIGRQPDCQLPLRSGMVSKRHARIERDDVGISVVDLESTNGTFVNGDKVVGKVRLNHNDILHFGDIEFRVRRIIKESSIFDSSQPGFLTVAANNPVVLETKLFLELLGGEGVVPFFQPIVRIADGSVVGYEVWGRAQREGLPERPAELFQIASKLGVERELSETFRDRGIEEGGQLSQDKMFFVNTHYTELKNPNILEPLKRYRKQYPQRFIVLEIHEAAVVDLEYMRNLRTELINLGFGLAYDDFGAGEGRLNELAEVPPHYLKFDISFVRNLGEASPAKRHLVETLVKLVHEMGITALAEGVETEADAVACEQLGFDLAQGYHYGRPAPAAIWTTNSPD